MASSSVTIPRMRDREPEPWQTNAPAPFLVLEREHGVVEVWGHGSDRFTVRARYEEQVIEGFSAARATAHALASGLE
jgi:hypothetical protein